MQLRHYELTFIIDAQLAPEKQEEVVNKFLDLLRSKNIEILNIEKWGKKKLAFPIDDRQYGYYLMTQFRAPTEAIPEIEQTLKLSTQIFRYLILHRDPKTLKLMKQEAEHLAREALYAAQKERELLLEKSAGLSDLEETEGLPLDVETEANHTV